MKKFVILCLCVRVLSAQNWTPFNPNYRYNYKFDNATLVTHVLFADSTKSISKQTTSYLNRVAAYTAVALEGNMPQFLERSIVEFAAGKFSFAGNSDFYIDANCNTGQSWLFDTANVITASCVVTGTQSIFGIIDSVKTILLNGIDTIKLSRSYGLIVFPERYSKGRYYRLRGIEKGSTYDSTALYGEKVPNAWDFYNFEVGKTYCRRLDLPDLKSTSARTHTTICQQITITGKQIISSGYVYQVDRYAALNTNKIHVAANNCSNGFSQQNTITFTNLSSPALVENKMYPGQIIGPIWMDNFDLDRYHYSNNATFQHVVSFGMNPNGTFYKFTGLLCNGLLAVVSGTLHYPAIKKGSQNQYTQTGNMSLGGSFATGLGYFGNQHRDFEYFPSLCLVCGPDFGWPITDLRKDEPAHADLYPNPVNSLLFLNLQGLKELSISNSLGKQVYSSSDAGLESVDTSAFPPGIYFIRVETSQGPIAEKFMVVH